MNVRDKNGVAIASAKDMAVRVKSIDLGRVSLDLEARGSAMIRPLSTPAECDALAALVESGNLSPRFPAINGRNLP